ncbi:MAG TPA: polysaccharide biosynthesis/export family protein [Candidatus Acidoferrales bacterium]|nr:polysaccharide biosynthesis/export family protein [Candidatus Acidoferrales bacterium]
MSSDSRTFARLLLSVALICAPLAAQPAPRAGSQETSAQKEKPALETTEDYNRRLQQMQRMLAASGESGAPGEYRIGPEDLLEITIFEAPEMNRAPRVSASGEISLPLLGAVRASGLTLRELESVLAELLRRNYMKDPHVSVSVKELQSRPVSVFGAVYKPGVFQVRGAKTVLEMLSMAEGLAADAGDTVIVMRGAGFPEGHAGAATVPSSGAKPETLEINLKSLLESGDARFNVPVYPGDIVKVTRAGIVYVVGEVKRPGGFALKSNENISVLQALALAEGLTRTSAKSHARIIRTDEATGKRSEMPVDLGRVLAGKAEDPQLRPRDIVFVPNSAARSALARGSEAALSIVTGVVIWRR